MNSKKAYSLIEVILSIIIMSVVSVSAVFIYKDFATLHRTEYDNELLKLEWLNTKYFLQQRLKETNELTQVNNNLYFQNNLLLKKVSQYSIQKSKKSIVISFCIQQRYCNTMVIIP